MMSLPMMLLLSIPIYLSWIALSPHWFARQLKKASTIAMISHPWLRRTIGLIGAVTLIAGIIYWNWAESHDPALPGQPHGLAGRGFIAMILGGYFGGVLCLAYLYTSFASWTAKTAAHRTRYLP